MADRKEPVDSDIVITETAHYGHAGRRVLIDAFLIATVKDRDEYTLIMMKKKAGGEYLSAKESFDEVHAMKRRAMGLKPLEAKPGSM